jgi:hypothetical protein
MCCDGERRECLFKYVPAGTSMWREESGGKLSLPNYWYRTAGYFYDTFAYEICYYGIYFYGIYIYGIYFYRALKFISLNCTVVRNT